MRKPRRCWELRRRRCRRKASLPSVGSAPADSDGITDRAPADLKPELPKAFHLGCGTLATAGAIQTARRETEMLILGHNRSRARTVHGSRPISRDRTRAPISHSLLKLARPRARAALTSDRYCSHAASPSAGSFPPGGGEGRAIMCGNSSRERAAISAEPSRRLPVGRRCWDERLPLRGGTRRIGRRRGGCWRQPLSAERWRTDALEPRVWCS